MKLHRVSTPNINASNIVLNSCCEVEWWSAMSSGMDSFCFLLSTVLLFLWLSFFVTLSVSPFVRLYSILATTTFIVITVSANNHFHLENICHVQCIQNQPSKTQSIRGSSFCNCHSIKLLWINGKGSFFFSSTTCIRIDGVACSESEYFL